MNVTYYLP